MKGIEFNKIAAAILVTGLVMLVCGTVAEALYFKDEGGESAESATHTEAKRGFQIAVENNASSGAAKSAEPEVPFEQVLASADPKKGEAISKKCTSCHSFDKDGPNKVGPALWGIVGRKPGAHDGFPYSDAMKGFTGTASWDSASLNTFLTKPQDYIKGTKMSFAGLSKAEDRAAVIRYLETLK
ncbi:MAG: cytochrome c family protein [Alphaproteobacteria bacterium]|nr:cytochrome c family protein [Alphaproteobacteria bacterium]